MEGKRKFTVAIIYLVCCFATTWLAILMKIGLTSGDFSNLILFISCGTAILSGAMAIENISKAGGIKGFFGNTDKKVQP